MYIWNAARTPIGSFQGTLSTLTSTELGAQCVKNLLLKSSVDPKSIHSLLMGQVLQGGVGQAPARQVAIKSGLGETVHCTTVNKVCGSGLEAIAQAHRYMKSEGVEFIIAGGMESMSQAPHFLSQSRTGVKFGPMKMNDLMQWDGLTDPYSQNSMGECAEICLKEKPLTRIEQDDFAIRSFELALKAQSIGIFQSEIAAVELVQKKGASQFISEDEGPKKFQLEKMKSLKPAFDAGGTITAANASTLNDGAAALLISKNDSQKEGCFKIHTFGYHSQNPTWFTTAPIKAIENALRKAKLSLGDIDLFEINEAFASVALYCQKDLAIPLEKLNIYGGAIALGHPLGASGARIVVTLMNGLQKTNGKFGVAALCIGGGEGLALVIERMR